METAQGSGTNVNLIPNYNSWRLHKVYQIYFHISHNLNLSNEDSGITIAYIIFVYDFSVLLKF